MGAEYVERPIMVVVLKNAVFVHVPKNAGSAISAALGGVDQYWPMHVPWRCLEDEGKPGFGFIRNPWARMHSLYYFLTYSPHRHLQRVDPVAIRGMGFKRWLLEGANWMSNEPVDGQIWIRQNREYLPLRPGNTYKNVSRLAHHPLKIPPQQRRPAMWWLDGLPPEQIGKVESLDADLTAIGGLLRFPTKPVRRTNETRHKPHDWRAEYDSETIEHVATYHALDIEAGNYVWE